MQAVILAGGEGRRLRPLTYKIPKPMISIKGKPFLQYLLEMIKYNGITEVVLLVSYLGDQIEKHFGDGSRLRLNIRYSYEKSPLGTGGALKNAQDILAENFLLLNGDTFLPIDYAQLIAHFYRYDKVGIITAYKNAERIVSNNIAVGKSDLVVGYNKKDSKNMTHVDAGAIVFKKGVIDFVTVGQTCSLEEDVFPQLIKIKEFLAFQANQRFYDIGSHKGLRLIEEVLK